MGQKVIPEKVEYFCDGCGAGLTKEHHCDFTLTTDEVLRDYSGSEMGNHGDHYELCSKCESSFKSWLDELRQ